MVTSRIPLVTLVSLASLVQMVLALSSCTTSKDTGNSPASEQVELCVEMCVKPLCSGVIEPVEGFEQMCANYCEQTASQAEARDCVDHFQILLECLDDLSCDQTLQWFDRKPDYPCELEEEVLANECEISIRGDDG